MKSFDDTLPEERSAEYEPLLTLLSDATRKPAPLAADEQTEALERVQERLRLFEEQTSQGEDVEMQEVEPLTMPSQQQGKKKNPARHGHIFRFLNTLAAVLVIGAIIGVSLLLFRHSSPSSGDAPRSDSTPGIAIGSPVAPRMRAVTVTTNRGGLTATLVTGSGPYFLSELLPMELALTNHSHTTYQLQGVAVAAPCDPALSVNYSTAGANTAHYTFPVYGMISCPMSITQFKPGQTIVIRAYVPLVDSGKIVLTEEARFLSTQTTPNQGKSISNAPSPLDGHWPSFHINVVSQIPSNRIITLHRAGSKVFVNTPVNIRPYVLYQYVVRCQDFTDGGGTESGNFIWTPTTTPISEPGCPGKNTQWTYAVSAPGYAIATGSYGS